MRQAAAIRRTQMFPYTIFPSDENLKLGPNLCIDSLHLCVRFTSKICVSSREPLFCWGKVTKFK